MAHVFLTIPATDSERLRTVEWLGANGITCFLRSRQVDAAAAGAQIGGAVTILVPEEQLQEAKQALAAMPAEGSSP
jgi:type III secretory pathway lipoprotein EscJ